MSQFFSDVGCYLAKNFQNKQVTPALIFSVLAVVTLLALYEFFVYRTVLRRSLYNKAFNICMATLPYFIATIILCLQSDMVITLGTIGALAIIRFRTAIKDPVDLLFILWSVHTGITCGCQLYGIALMTSLAVTVILLILNHVHFQTKSHVLVVHTQNTEVQTALEAMLQENAKRFRVKSRNFTGEGMHFVYELVTAQPDALVEKLAGMENIRQFSLMEYEPDDIV